MGRGCQTGLGSRSRSMPRSERRPSMNPRLAGARLGSFWVPAPFRGAGPCGARTRGKASRPQPLDTSRTRQGCRSPLRPAAQDRRPPCRPVVTILARSPARCVGAGFLNGGGAAGDGHARAGGKGRLGLAPGFCGTGRGRTGEVSCPGGVRFQRGCAARCGVGFE
jgi:hypothetical protein